MRRKDPCCVGVGVGGGSRVLESADRYEYDLSCPGAHRSASSVKKHTRDTLIS